MALVRCPQCGRVADGTMCFACGHEWADDGGAAASSQSPKAEEGPAAPADGQAPLDVDLGLEIDVEAAEAPPAGPMPAAPVGAPAPPPLPEDAFDEEEVPVEAPEEVLAVSDPMAEAGDFFDAAVGEAVGPPLTGPPATPAPVPAASSPADAFEADLDAAFDVEGPRPVDPDRTEPFPMPEVSGGALPDMTTQAPDDDATQKWEMPDLGAMDLALGQPRADSRDPDPLEGILELDTPLDEPPPTMVSDDAPRTGALQPGPPPPDGPPGALSEEPFDEFDVDLMTMIEEDTGAPPGVEAPPDIDGISVDDAAPAGDLPDPLAGPPSSAAAPPTRRAPAPLSDGGEVDRGHAARLAARMGALAEVLEGEGRTSEAALLYEVQLFLSSLS